MVGQLSPSALGHRRSEESFVLVFHAGTFALSAITRAGLPSKGLGRLGQAELSDLVARAATCVAQSPESFLTGPLVAAGAKYAGLTAPERAALEEGGIDLEAAPAPHGLSAAERSAVEFAALRAESYGADEVARLLDVDASRIRQRLTSRPPSLFGFKVGKSWRVPTFQFTERALVPGIDLVVAALPRDLPAVAVRRWISVPSPDLEIDEEPVSPLDWLRAGRDPAKAAELAAAL
ncbi:MAG: hypothetical protein WCC48_12825 [Anaeromyxobacteraceae bacterium]